MFNGGLLYFFWYMFIIYLFVMVIWMFIRVFADIFHRENLSGWGKSGWILVIFIIPFIGILIYMIVRPKNTEQDQRDMAADAGDAGAAGRRLGRGRHRQGPGPLGQGRDQPGRVRQHQGQSSRVGPQPQALGA